MERVCGLKSGDGEKPRSGWLQDADGLNVAVMAKAGVDYATACCKNRIPSRGSGPSGSFNLASVGSLHAATSAAGATSSGVRV